LIEDENEVFIAGVDEHAHSNNTEPKHSNVFTVNLRLLYERQATNPSPPINTDYSQRLPKSNTIPLRLRRSTAMTERQRRSQALECPLPLFLPFVEGIMRAMNPSRLILPLLCAFSLLLAQQVGAAHTLSHTLEELSQHEKHTSDSPACEKCAAYAQLGSALSNGAIDFTPLKISSEAVRHIAATFQSIHLLAAVARGPPSILQAYA
jgi:hypothetical protein